MITRIFEITAEQACVFGVENCHGNWSSKGTATLAKSTKAAIAWVKRLGTTGFSNNDWAVWPVAHFQTGEVLGFAVGALYPAEIAEKAASKITIF